jgi:hypothetical protein
MEFETFEMPENKRIIITSRKIDIPVIAVNKRKFPLLRILNDSVLENMTPKDLAAYSLEPSKELDSNAAEQFGDFIYRICGFQGISLAVLKPEVIRAIGAKGYNKADKLRQYTHYETPEMFERAVGF